MSSIPVGEAGRISDSTQLVTGQNIAIPQTATPPGDVYVGDWIYRLEKHAGMEGTMLGKMVRDMESTFRVAGRALHVSGKASVEKIKKEQGVFKVSAVVAALLGNLLYGTSLLTLTIIKTVVWVPMIAFSAVLGGMGAILLHTLEEAEQRTLAQGALDFFGHAAAGFGEAMGFVAFLPSGILSGIGYLGAAFIEVNVLKPYYVPYTEIDAKLLRALKQANTSNIPVPKSFIPEGLSKDNLTAYFGWIDELGVDFNETKLFKEKQTPLLCIQESYSEDRPSTIWSKDRLEMIKESLEKASIWAKLLPETRDQINHYINP